MCINKKDEAALTSSCESYIALRLYPTSLSSVVSYKRPGGYMPIVKYKVLGSLQLTATVRGGSIAVTQIEA